MGGGQVGEGVEVAVEGINLLLDRGEVNRDGDMDVGHLSGDSADGIKDDRVVMVGEGGDEVLGGRVNKERGEDQTGKNGRSEEKIGSDHLS
jgi:asparagine synthetase B (glutamine-hydrolysing)